VGDVYNGSSYVSLIEHWNGSKWKLVNHPRPGTGGGFEAVSGTSAKDIWAVGRTYSGSGPQHTLIEHWNGKKWTRIPSPNRNGMGFTNYLQGVSAVGAKDAWVVGSSYNINGKSQTLTEHWNGKSWKIVKRRTPAVGCSTTRSPTSWVPARAPRGRWATTPTV